MIKKSLRIILCCFILLLQFTVFSQSWKDYTDSAKIYVKEKKFNQGIDAYLKAKALLKIDSLLSESYLQTCKNLAVVYFSNGQRNEAEPVIWEGIATVKQLRGNRNAEYALFCDMLGQKYFNSDPKKAGDYFLEAKDIKAFVFGEQSAEYAQSCNNLGAVYNTNGSWKKALQLHLTAKDIREKLTPPDSLSLAQSCNNLGDLYRLTGQFDLAEPNCQKAEAIRKIYYLRNKDAYGKVYAISSVNLANLYRDMGQYTKAEHYYIQAKNTREKLLTKQHPDYAASCDILATLYHLMGKDDQSELLYVEAKDLRSMLTPVRQSIPYAESADNLANLYRDMGRYKEAEEKVHEARIIWEKMLDSADPALAINYSNIGLLYSAMGDYGKAESFFLKARKIWKSFASEKDPFYASNAGQLATVYWNTGELMKANELFNESYSSQYEQLTRFFQFTSEKEKEEYVQNISGSGDQYYSFVYHASPAIKAGQAYKVSLFNRGLILNAANALRNTIYQSKDSLLLLTYEEWINNKERLANVYSGKVQMNKDEISDLERLTNSIEKDLTSRSSRFSEYAIRTPGWKAVQQKLKQNEIAIEFVESSYFNGRRWTDSVFYFALLLKSDRQEPSLVKLFEKKQLEALLNLPGYELHVPVSKEIYHVIWQNLESRLKSITTIYFTPSGLLNRIAFAALPVSENAVLSDKYTLIQLATTASVIDQRNILLEKTDQLQLYGGIKYDADSTALKNAVYTYAGQTNRNNARSVTGELSRSGTFSYLPGTAIEVQGIKERAMQSGFKMAVLSGNEAPEESFKALNGTASPSLLHIATHGFFYNDTSADNSYHLKNTMVKSGKTFRQSADPLFRSGLLFTGANLAWKGKPVEGIDDGILTAYEVSNMYLPNTKLVVLSACETALGDLHGSEGVYGLQRAFKIAGVQNMVMSLWKVPDTETAEFMEIFYQQLFTHKPIHEAFYFAQRKMKNKYRNEPDKWAAWILVR